MRNRTKIVLLERTYYKVLRIQHAKYSITMLVLYIIWILLVLVMVLTLFCVLSFHMTVGL